MSTHGAIAFSANAGGLCAGCSFNRDWKRAAAYKIGTNDLIGQWTGHWRSDVTGHHGSLRCIVTPHAPNSYMARFRARFWKILTASYAVALTATNINGEFKFSGSANLGRLAGGVYTYEGSATRTHFHSTYRSSHDHGVFEMHRPPPEPNSRWRMERPVEIPNPTY